MVVKSAFEALKGRFSNDELAYLFEVLDGPEPVLTSALIASAAHEVLAYMPFEPAKEVSLRRGMILVRADSRLRAREGRPMGQGTSLQRRGRGLDAINVNAKTYPYSDFFAVEDLNLSHTRFDGTTSATMDRAAFVSADAVTVLPYDPVRQRVLLIEQFRVAPFVRGDTQPWLLEPIAGRVDAGETEVTTARREALEEAGIDLRELHLVSGYYPSPGALTEYITSYVGIADLPDDVVGVGGLASEDEDIASMILSFDELMSLADQGALDTGPLMLSALWLARHKDRLSQA
jgi:nudix-type nucleoside diphosphatase (YffH/AdpP family)